LQTYLNLVQILLSVVLILVVLLQAKGSGFAGALGGGDSSVYRSRRGVERTLFNFTIGLAVLFVLLSVVTVKFFS